MLNHKEVCSFSKGCTDKSKARTKEQKMKTRASRNEEVRRAIIHEERSSSPPDFQMLGRTGNNLNGRVVEEEPKMNTHTVGPEIKKEDND